MKCSKIILTGPGASGKDFLRSKMQNRGMKYSISHTTRPKRTNETDGVDYFFVDIDTFKNMINSNMFLEWTTFKDGQWYYGTSYKQFDEADLLILTPKAIKELPDSIRSKSFVMYIDSPEETRKARLESRADADSVERRLKTDKEDFFDFFDYDIKINQADF